jgi:hypothetical protein
LAFAGLAFFFALGVKGLGGVFSIRLRTSSSLLGLLAMNTPKKIKRHNPKFKSLWDRDAPTGHFSGVIGDPAIGHAVASLAAGFVHLENAMAMVLAVLLGSDDNVMAGYVMRAIKSPKGRIDLMRNLLELAPSNKGLPADYDDILDEFWDLNGLRNDFVHAEWWTHSEGSVYATFFDKHGMGLVNGRKIEATEITDIIGRMNTLVMTILRVAFDTLHQRQLAKAGGQVLQQTPATSTHPNRPSLSYK